MATPAQHAMDRGFIALLFAHQRSPAWRCWPGATARAMALLLALHLGVVMALFLTLPYGKFAHGVYRCGGAAEVGDREAPAEPVTAGCRMSLSSSADRADSGGQPWWSCTQRRSRGLRWRSRLASISAGVSHSVRTMPWSRARPGSGSPTLPVKANRR